MVNLTNAIEDRTRSILGVNEPTGSVKIETVGGEVKEIEEFILGRIELVPEEGVIILRASIIN